MIDISKLDIICTAVEYNLCDCGLEFAQTQIDSLKRVDNGDAKVKELLQRWEKIEERLLKNGEK